MATAAAASNFSWNKQHNNERFKPCSGRNIKPARTLKHNGSFPSLTRSRSFGSPTFPRRKPFPIKQSKSVHFADSKGLDLVSVLTFNEEQELHNQFSKLASFAQTTAGKRRFNYEEGSCKNKKSNDAHSIKLPDKIVRQLAWQRVYLLKTEFSKSGNICGEVYVANLAYEKRVKARFTWDSWRTQQEIDGEFHSNCTKDVDKFVFEISIPKDSTVKNFKVEFAVSYTVLGDTYWDNNNGFNYHVLFASHN